MLDRTLAIRFIDILRVTSLGTLGRFIPTTWNLVTACCGYYAVRVMAFSYWSENLLAANSGSEEQEQRILHRFATSKSRSLQDIGREERAPTDEVLLRRDERESTKKKQEDIENNGCDQSSLSDCYKTCEIMPVPAEQSFPPFLSR